MTSKWYCTGLINFGLLAITILYIMYVIVSISTDFMAHPEYHLLVVYDIFALIMLLFVLIGLLFIALRRVICKIGIGPITIRIKYLTKEQIVNWNQIESITTERFISIPSYSLILKSGEQVSLGTINKRLLERIEANMEKSG